MKTCSRCEDTKPLTEFYKHSSMADGYLNQCKSCRADYQREYQSQNREKVNGYNRKHYHTKVDKSAHSKRVGDWNKSNRDYCNTIQAERRAKVVLGEQQWSEEEREAIRDLYWLARDLRAVTGEDYHVDHIKPLSKGGEHRLDNLQILPADMNLSKGAKYGDQTA